MHSSCIKILIKLTKLVISYDLKRQIIDMINNIKSIDAEGELLHLGQISKKIYEVWNFNSGKYLFTSDTK